MQNTQGSKCKKIISLYQTGMRVIELAHLFSISKQRVDQILNNGKVVRRPRKFLTFMCSKCGKVGGREQFSPHNEFCLECYPSTMAVYWSKKHRIMGCKGCGKNTKKHYYSGFCHKCFHKEFPHFWAFYSLIRKTFNIQNKKRNK